MYHWPLPGEVCTCEVLLNFVGRHVKICESQIGSTMPDHRLLPKLRELTREAQSLGLEIERGQASTPLADHCASLLNEHLRRAPAVAVLATHPRARAEALQWLLGRGRGGALLRAVPSAAAAAAMTEIQLEGEGYAVLGTEGRREELADLPAFLHAVEAQWQMGRAASTDSSGVEPRPDPHLGHGQSLSLLVPASIEELLLQPGLVSELQARAPLFVVAHEEGNQGLDPTAWEAVRHATQGVQVLWPVSTGLTEGAAPGPWWRDLCTPGMQVLDPLALVIPTATSPLQGAVSECFDAWALQVSAVRLGLAVFAIKERHEHELRQIQVRRQRDEMDLRPEIGSDINLRRPFDLARVALSDELAALAKAPLETARRSFLPEGSLTQALGHQLRRLEHADLEREPGAKSIKLSLAAIAQGQLVQTLRRTLKEELSRDVSQTVEGLEALRQQLEPELEAAVAEPVRLTLPAPEADSLWAQIGDMVSIDIRYRGEMPRRGIFQRLGEGRKAVFAGMMVLSLLGSFVGFSWRGIGVLGFAFLLVFLAVVGLTYRSWKQEDAERLDKELERVREQLHSECRRVATEVQREKQARLAAHLEQIKRQTLMRIDDLMRERQTREQAALNEQRERARRRKEQLDRQMREAHTLGQRMGKLLTDVQRLSDDAAADARDQALKRKLLA